jgi:23S rRNA pseudouridine2605 synthase
LAGKKDGHCFRLNQAIAKTGYCARRRADELIAAGSVRVNGAIAREYNMSIDPMHDRLSINGKELTINNYIYVVMNKPAGVVTSCADEKGRRSVLDLLPAQLRFLRPVGRLDMYSTGLLLLTNDGTLTQRLTHPAAHEIKRYEVTVEGQLSPQALHKLRHGVNLPDGKTLPTQVFVINSSKDQTQFKIELIQGRNRQIRRMCKHLGYKISRLTRTAVGALELGKLPSGVWRYLTDYELRKLGVGH